MTETTNHPTADGQPPKSKPTTEESNENGAGPLLKKPDVLRDPQGRFERHGKTISKTAKTKNSNNLGLINNPPIQPKKRGGKRPGAGRPKGALNLLTVGLKEAILAAGEAVGNDLDGTGMTGYLKT